MNMIKTIEELESIYGAVNPNALTKQTSVVTAEYRQLIEASPFVALATIGPSGMDCSPRGDLPGVVRVIDQTTMQLPDRRGNRRIDSLRNIVQDGRVALLFLIPGIVECMRVNGTAVLRTDAELLNSYSVGGNAPASVVEITVADVYFQCARAIKRSQLWDPGVQVDRETLPTPGQIMTAITNGDFDGRTYEAELQPRQAKTLY